MYFISGQACKWTCIKFLTLFLYFVFFFFSFSDELRSKYLIWHYNILNGVNLYKKLYSTIKYVFQSARYSSLRFLMYSFCLCKQYWFATPRWLFPTGLLCILYLPIIQPHLFCRNWYDTDRFCLHSMLAVVSIIIIFFGVFFFKFPMKHNNQMLDSLFTTLNRINIKVILCYFFVDLLQKSQSEFNKQ